MNLEFLHCRGGRRGSPSGAPPVLFVHGAFCGAWIWAETFLPYFCQNGFGSHAISLRGHGGSDGVLAWASLADYVDDLESAVARIGAAPILIGHSMGGLVVQHYLSRGHKAPAAVFLASVPPSGLASSAMHLSMYSADLVWQLGLLQMLGPEAVPAEVIAKAFLSPFTSPADIAHLVPRLQRESHRVAAELMAPPQPVPPAGPDKPPMLVLGGDRDIFLPVSAFRETATYYGADLKILKDAPHGLMVDTAWWQPVADTIIDWLRANGL